METIETKPSGNHLTAIALLSQSHFTTSISISEVTLEGIQELILFFGGRITTREVNDQHTPYITYSCLVNNCHVFASQMVKNIAVINQQASFGGFEMDFVKGSKLTILDNQYFVLSNDAE
jgi:hypothetical protein